ncbi:expressed unknown protein [Ectocarpus siliculosus]|uniref:RING-type domain-containing protein n=1 Tax=Ectocarpus siliculosus TaxID=2880 RepID=D8LC33_ECTSI|nr:expressed unknown protein [Ectocarpus siliculosus]|eukprot:CBN79216.1 expressed unknown protein [Ectocarpus siliculosus]
MPDNELEAAKGLHVEDIDCSLVVRPTRTALDLRFFGEVSYSFEIVAARLVRPPKRPPDARSGRCRNKCSPGKACPCNHDSPARSRRLAEDVEPPGKTEVALSVPEGDGEGQEGEAGGGGEGGGVHPHHSLNMGVNDVATLVLEDNQGITYDFYTFQVVEFDADSGAMALDRWNLFHCGVFRYSCALENISKVEITEGNVYMMSAHAFEHLRQTKEFGLRVIFSVPLGASQAATAHPRSPRPNNAGMNFSDPGGSSPSSDGDGISAVSGTVGGAPVARAAARRAAGAPRRRRWGVLFRRLLLCGRAGWCFGGRGWWRRPAARGVLSTSGELMYLNLLFGKKELDDRNLRRPVEMVNELLLRFANDVEVDVGEKKEGNCCVCFRRRSRVVTFPCMHMATCPQCSESLTVCPLCRANISEKHTVFL